MNQTLDINTIRGRIAAEDQRAAAEIVCGGSSCQFFHTDDTGPAKVDGIIVRNGVVCGVAEIKTRENTLEDLMGQWKGEWLLTYQKLLDVAGVSQLLAVPGYGMLYLPNSSCVLVTQLTNRAGLITCNPRIQRTTTQATCNGGKADRQNAFIDMRNASIYRG